MKLNPATFFVFWAFGSVHCSFLVRFRRSLIQRSSVYEIRSPVFCVKRTKRGAEHMKDQNGQQVTISWLAPVGTSVGRTEH